MISTARSYLVLALLGSLALAAGVQSCRLQTERADHAETRAGRERDRTAWERASREAVELARAEEQRRTAEVQKVANETLLQLDRARDDARASASAGERLRDRLRAITAACRPAASDPAAPSGGSAPGAPADLLADVQRRLDEAADGVAGFADRAAIAADACARSYDALTPTATNTATN